MPKHPNKKRTWKEATEQERMATLKAMGIDLEGKPISSRSTGKLEAQRVKRAEER